MSSVPMALRDQVPAAEGAGLHWVSGRRKWVLLVSMGTVFFTLLTLYASVLGVLLPNQIQNLDPVGKAQTLGVIYAITSVFSTLTTPIAGALSDRTRSRFGRRTPWIIVGGTIGGTAIILTPHAPGLVGITAIWLVAVVSLNAMQPAITTLVADRFSPTERGLASGVVGGAMTAGVSFGTFFAGTLADRIQLAYGVVGAAIIVACLAFVAINPEPRVALSAAPPFRLGAFLKGFWISPREHPDFAWAFAGRFAIYMGYQAILTYLLYILQDHIGLSQSVANATIATMSIVTFVALVFSGLGSGVLSDRLGRRKPLVFIASLIMALAVAMPLFAPTPGGMMAYAVLIGLGYGAFMSVDLALMTQVLPKAREGEEDATGKDLGILTTAINVPQILSPVMAAMLLSLTGNSYPTLFIVSGLFVIAGSFLVLPIRSVR
ncbi:MFS transporter [Sphingomonas sp. CFBP 13706]|uniref:MFS transporter n=1 Tax=Sphingomonas sp. CFBP 13706 TaxID=2775314 RepID=UPI00177DC5CD|nr:MFS transporter [Sphingomonas sp. CFBP 13706]MBD8736674.1 MFS transporter [Sphingomonas sp. CFBP 13706]